MADACRLLLAAEGREERCPRGACAFWEPGGAVVEGGCVFDRLGLDVRDPGLARYLLELRERLDAARRATQGNTSSSVS